MHFSRLVASPNRTFTDDDTLEYEGLDEHVRAYLDELAKPGARTTWMGWFPRAFTELLTSFNITTKKAHELALEIRNIITNGMDDIWRLEREERRTTHIQREKRDQPTHSRSLRKENPTRAGPRAACEGGRHHKTPPQNEKELA